jgi:hypothetical protein
VSPGTALPRCVYSVHPLCMAARGPDYAPFAANVGLIVRGFEKQSAGRLLGGSWAACAWEVARGVALLLRVARVLVKSSRWVFVVFRFVGHVRWVQEARAASRYVCIREGFDVCVSVVDKRGVII